MVSRRDHRSRDPSALDQNCDPADYLHPNETLPISNSELNAIGEGLDARLRQYHCDRVGNDNQANPKMWDESVIDFIAGWGPISLLSHSVIRTISAWEREADVSTSKLEEVGAALVRFAKVRWGHAKGSITRQHVISKERAVPELKKLKSLLRAEWPESPQSAIQFVEQQIETSPTFSFLRDLKLSFLYFINQNPSILMSFRGSNSDSRANGLSAQRFFDEWDAWSENLDAEHVRQQISRKRTHLSDL